MFPQSLFSMIQVCYACLLQRNHLSNLLGTPLYPQWFASKTKLKNMTEEGNSLSTLLVCRGIER